MPKEAKITRTITSTEVTVTCVDIDKEETFNTTIIIPRTFKDNTALMKQVSKQLDNDNVKALRITSKNVITQLRGMTESDFIKYSTILPDRPVKKTEENA